MFLNQFNKIFISKHLKLKLLFVLLFSTFLSYSQERKMIEILAADYAEAVQNNANAQRLVGKVEIKHKEILMWCDTAYTYSGTNKVDAIGHVHINQGDTLDLYAQKVYYNGDQSFASAMKDVRLINKTTTLYTDTLDYNLETNIGYYDDSGTIVDSTTTITSIIGRYIIDEDLIYLYLDVVGTNDKFTLESDTVNYNTATGRININGPTTIRDSANTLYAERGWYNSKTGESELTRNPVVSNKTQNISAKYIHYNKENKSGKALGSVRIQDTENQSIILGKVADYSDELGTAVVTDSAVYINYNDKDTLYLHADTLRMVPDTIKDKKVISAYHKVRFFRNDLQGICDSLVYYTRDSLVQLHYNPIIWSEMHQLSSDVIEMKQNENAPDEIHMTRNSFIISKQDSGRYDQIKGKEMIGYITNRNLTRIDVDGSGQTLYYAREKENVIGLNRAESSKISIMFKEGKIDQIKFFKKPEGELKPLTELTDADKRLKGFEWKIYLRPLSKYDIFERETAAEREAIMERENTKKQTQEE